MTWTVSDVMTKSTTTSRGPTAGITTTGDTPLAVAASLLFQHHATVLGVVDSRNHLVGTVTRSQVLKAFLRSDRAMRREILKVVGRPAAARVGRVEVEVVRGLVQLQGEIESEVEAERLTSLIRAVPGVVGVESRLSAPAAKKTA
jgi:CBS domain-containing protein